MEQVLPPVNAPVMPIARPVYAGTPMMLAVAACAAAIVLFVLHQLRSGGAAPAPQVPEPDPQVPEPDPQELPEEGGSENLQNKNVRVIKEELESVAKNYRYLITNDLVSRFATIVSDLNANNLGDACQILNEMKCKAPQVLIFSSEAENILALYRQTSTTQHTIPVETTTVEQVMERSLMEHQNKEYEEAMKKDRAREEEEKLVKNKIQHTIPVETTTVEQVMERSLMEHQNKEYEEAMKKDRAREEEEKLVKNKIKSFRELQGKIKVTQKKNCKIADQLGKIGACLARFKTGYKNSEYTLEALKRLEEVNRLSDYSQLECPENIYSQGYKEAVRGNNKEIKSKEYQDAKQDLDETYNEYAQEINYFRENFSKKAEWEEILKKAKKS